MSCDEKLAGRIIDDYAAEIDRLCAIEDAAKALVAECDGGKRSPSLGALAKLESALYIAWRDRLAGPALTAPKRGGLDE